MHFPPLYQSFPYVVIFFLIIISQSCDSWDRLRLPHEPKSDKRKKMDVWTDGFHSISWNRNFSHLSDTYIHKLTGFIFPFISDCSLKKHCSLNARV